jgi:hypothetical protein
VSNDQFYKVIDLTDEKIVFGNNIYLLVVKIDKYKLPMHLILFFVISIKSLNTTLSSS